MQKDNGGRSGVGKTGRLGDGEERPNIGRRHERVTGKGGREKDAQRQGTAGASGGRRCGADRVRGDDIRESRHGTRLLAGLTGHGDKVVRMRNSGRSK